MSLPTTPPPQTLPNAKRGPSKLWLLVIAEGLAALIGFVVLMAWARRLSPTSLSSFELAFAATSWLLVIVRGGFDEIALREAARRPDRLAFWTGQLLGIRLLLAGLASTIGLVFLPILPGPSRVPMTIALATLWLSALQVDLPFRVTGRFGVLASAVLLRTVAWLILGLGLIVEGAAPWRCSLVWAIVESLAPAMLWAWAWRSGWRWRVPIVPRLIVVLGRRALAVGLIRFLRVGGWTIDVLTLGMLGAGGWAGYALARRLTLAWVGLGCLVPSARSPMLARALRDRSAGARSALGRSWSELLGFALPIAIGVAWLADDVMAWAFALDDSRFTSTLRMFAAQGPLILAVVLIQTTWIAARRESEALKLGAIGLGLRAIAVVVAGSGNPTDLLGPLLLVAEAANLAWGLRRLQSEGLLAWDRESTTALLVGSAVLVALLVCTEPMPMHVLVRSALAGSGYLGALALIHPRGLRLGTRLRRTSTRGVA